jgi:hypothetical protein
MKRARTTIAVKHVWLPDEVWQLIVDQVELCGQQLGTVLSLLGACKHLALLLTRRLKAWLLRVLYKASGPGADVNYQLSGDAGRDLAGALCLYSGKYGLLQGDTFRAELCSELYCTVFEMSPTSPECVPTWSTVVLVLHLAWLNLTLRYQRAGDGLATPYYFRLGNRVCVNGARRPEPSDTLGDYFYRDDSTYRNLRHHPRAAFVQMPTPALAYERAVKAAARLTDPEQRLYYGRLLQKQSDAALLVALQYTLLRPKLAEPTTSNKGLHNYTKLRDVVWRGDQQQPLYTHLMLHVADLELVRCEGGQRDECEKRRAILFDQYVLRGRAFAALCRYRRALLRPPRDTEPTIVVRSRVVIDLSL